MLPKLQISAMVCEVQAMNTIENAIYAVPLLRDRSIKTASGLKKSFFGKPF